MKSTLIEIVTDILSDMDGDYVTSINDTDEARQVAQIVKSTYQAMMSNRNWPHTARLLQVTSYSDNTLPTHMKIEDSWKEMISIYYNSRVDINDRIDYRQVRYIDPDHFLRLSNQRNSTDINCLVVTDPSGVTLLITNNKSPEYYTSFNDTDLVFDSYDADIDSTLQASKTQARAYTIPAFEMEDDFVPDLPDEAFSALIEESKSKAQLKLHQIQDIKAEQESSKQQRWLSRKGWRVHEKDIYPYDFGRGRHGGRYRKDPTFRRD